MERRLQDRGRRTSGAGPRGWVPRTRLIGIEQKVGILSGTNCQCHSVETDIKAQNVQERCRGLGGHTSLPDPLPSLHA